jgi:hypothetical protein
VVRTVSSTKAQQPAVAKLRNDEARFDGSQTLFSMRRKTSKLWQDPRANNRWAGTAMVCGRDEFGVDDWNQDQ